MKAFDFGSLNKVSRGIAIIIFLFLLLLSCDTTQNITTTKDEDLADVLRDVPGLSVVGKGENATVRVRGLTDYYGSGEPLFVLDGIEITGGFYSLSQRVEPDYIRTIRVLKNKGDTFKYGNLGVNGVIEISTL